MKYPPYTSQTQKVRTIRTLKKEGKKKVEYAIAITIHRNKIKGKKKKKQCPQKGQKFSKNTKKCTKISIFNDKNPDRWFFPNVCSYELSKPVYSISIKIRSGSRMILETFKKKGGKFYKNWDFFFIPLFNWRLSPFPDSILTSHRSIISRN